VQQSQTNAADTCPSAQHGAPYGVGQPCGETLADPSHYPHIGPACYPYALWHARGGVEDVMYSVFAGQPS